ncbi:MAG: transglycosylase SLT domain-containing protein [Rhodospirillales bacterium]
MDGYSFTGVRLVSAVVAVAVAALCAYPDPTVAEERRPAHSIARLPDASHRPSDRDARTVAVLATADAERYRRIFAAQAGGRWSDADAEIGRLGDRLLLGHVLAQRYLDARHYRAGHDALAAWLAAYADHPDAPAIRFLAAKRAPAEAEALPAVAYAAAAVRWDNGAMSPAPPAPPERTPALRKEAARILESARKRLRAGHHAEAVRYLAHPHVVRVLSTAEIDHEIATIAGDLYQQGEAGQAFVFAERAVRRSGDAAPAAMWIAGLTAFRLARYDAAATYFEALAAVPDLPAWPRSAAAFWAARATLDAGRPERVEDWLAAAAEHPDTFYGLIAHRILGTEPAFTWDVPPLPAEMAGRAMAEPALRRALALLQSGAPARAERELAGIAGRGGLAEPLTVLALAEQVRFAPLSLRAAGLFAESGGRHDAALYPIPGWVPPGGFTVDPALVYAFMRQESAFDVRAVSRSGAVGLMQLMPATAAYVGGAELVDLPKEALFDPAVNLDLGQRYLRYLLEHDTVRGDVALLALAYNGGPGNLARWQRDLAATGDRLLFIESIPSRQARTFVQRVLANYWIYQMRMGVPTPSLDALAAGGAPLYISAEDEPPGVTRDAH